MKKLLLILLTVLVSFVLNATDFNKTSNALSYTMFKSEFMNMNSVMNFASVSKGNQIDENIIGIIIVNITLSGLCYLTYTKNDAHSNRVIVYFMIPDVIFTEMLLAKKYNLRF